MPQLKRNTPHVYAQQGAHAEALPLYERAATLCRELDQQANLAASLQNMALCKVHLCDYLGAERLATQAVVGWEALGHRLGVAQTYCTLAHCALALGDTVRARRVAEQKLAEAGTHGLFSMKCEPRVIMAELCAIEGDSATALQLLRDAGALYRTDGAAGYKFQQEILTTLAIVLAGGYMSDGLESACKAAVLAVAAVDRLYGIRDIHASPHELARQRQVQSKVVATLGASALSAAAAEIAERDLDEVFATLLPEP